MANLKAIRRRIVTVRNTQKITRAMKMVAAARLRRAQEAVEQFRAYADLMTSVLAEVASEATEEDHPLLARRDPERSLVLVISSDRGLCGGFNSSLNRSVLRRVKSRNPKPSLAIIGRKARDFFSRQQVSIDKVHRGVYEDPSYGTAARIARELADRYAEGEIDQIELSYNEFVSLIKQTPVTRQLLPVTLPKREEEVEEREEAGKKLKPVGYIFEPDRTALLRRLLPRYVEVQIFRAIIESIAAEHAARMTAMDAATNNAEDMLDHLTLVYNRARQSAITSELMDIVGGAEALHE